MKLMENKLEKLKNKIISKIDSFNTFAILVSDPDYDSIGSGLALFNILKQKKSVKLFSDFNLYEYNFLPGVSNFIITDISKVNFGHFDCLIFLDCNDIDQILDNQKKRGEKELKIPKNVYTINIDHHKTNKHFANINFVSTKFSSTGEALCYLFLNKYNLSQNTATNLLAAIIGDTNCFRNKNTNDYSFSCVLTLRKITNKYNYLIQKIFYSLSKFELKMNIEATKSIKFKSTGKYKYVYAIFDRIKHSSKNLSKRQKSLLQDEILNSINNVDFSLLIVKRADNTIKLSFRSRKMDVSKIAEIFGGGGHKLAAGAVSSLSIDSAISKIDKYLLKT